MTSAAVSLVLTVVKSFLRTISLSTAVSSFFFFAIKSKILYKGLSE